MPASVCAQQTGQTDMFGHQMLKAPIEIND